MKIKTAGRPKKKNAIQSGELQWELCRFSFIADRRIVAGIKQISKDYDVTIKYLMNKILSQAIRDEKVKEKKGPILKGSAKASRNTLTKNEMRLIAYQKKEAVKPL